MIDKREYAYARLLGEMCDREPYGLGRMGDEESAERLQMKSSTPCTESCSPPPGWSCSTAAAPPWSGVEAALSAALAPLPRDGIRDIAAGAPHPPASEVKRVEEAMDVTQANWAWGFACGSDDYAAMLLGNTLFGGSSNSKLFLNVREKLALCYYASSNYHRQKRIITVSSGIEFANYQRAFDEIMAQLEAVRRGELEDWELDGARSTLLNAYASMGDSQGKLRISTWARRPPARRTRGAAGGAGAAGDAGADLRGHGDRLLDTVYFLKGKEAAE